MAHVESADQAVARLEDSAERHSRTIRKAHGDPAKIERADFHHLRTVRNTRRQVRFNTGISEPTRGVLGTTGSPEALRRIQKVGDLAGQPLVVVEAVEDDESTLVQALVGKLTGGVQVRKGYFRDLSAVGNGRSLTRRSAAVFAETQPLLRVARDEISGEQVGEEWWRVSRVDTEDPQDPGRVLIAEIELDERSDTTDPADDFEVHYADESTLFLGEEAVRGCELFEPDLKTILTLTGYEV